MDMEWLMKIELDIIGDKEGFIRQLLAALAGNSTDDIPLQGETIPVYNLKEGNLECHAPGQKAWFDSSFSCWIFQLPFFLESIGFGYICFPFIFAIILISIFGKIKENYRWFILNQGIWDLFVAYNFLCRKPSFIQWFYRYTHTIHTYDHWLEGVNQNPSTCFYAPATKYGTADDPSITNTLLQSFVSAATFASYAPLFLLTFSRFLSLYFQYFHKKFNSAIRVSVTIFMFNFIFIFAVNLIEWGKLIRSYIASNDYKNCMKACRNCTPTDCMQLIGPNPYPLLQYIQIGIPPLLLLFSNIFALFIFTKIFKQIKFQSKINQQKIRSKNIRIAAIILFQCFSMTFLIFCTFLQDFIWIFENENASLDFRIKQAKEKFILEHFSSWVRLLSLPATIQSFTIIRIFFDSIITLTVLSEYRKSVTAVIKFFVTPFLMGLKKIKCNLFKNRGRSSRISSTMASSSSFSILQSNDISLPKQSPTTLIPVSR